MERRYQMTRARFKEQIDSGQIVLLRSRSSDATRLIEDNTLDWVYIDGDHQFDAVRSDLETFFRKIKPGGYIIGDDYYRFAWWGDGVVSAVTQFCRERRISCLIRNAQYVLQKPSRPFE